MQAKANYCCGLSHLIGPAQLVGPGALLQSARCNLQAAGGFGWGRGRLRQRATEGRGSGPLDRFERGALGGGGAEKGSGFSQAPPLSEHCAAQRRAAGYGGAAATVAAGCRPATSHQMWAGG